MNQVAKSNIAGICALLMWSTIIGLIRSVTEAFGTTLGTALIYTIGGIFIFINNGKPDIKKIPKVYLFGVGCLFVMYELVFSQSIAMSTSVRQTLEVGMLNYLWPCLTVVFSMWINKARLRWMVWPGTMISIVGLYRCVAANGNLSFPELLSNIALSPLPYIFGCLAGIGWALYCNLSARYSEGHNGVPFFFTAVAFILWINFFTRGGQLYYPGIWPVLQLLVIGIIMGISYSLWEKGISNGNFFLLALCSYFSPAASMIFSSIWLNIMPPLAFWQGVGLVIIGALICWFSSIHKSSMSAVTNKQ